MNKICFKGGAYTMLKKTNRTSLVLWIIAGILMVVLLTIVVIKYPLPKKEMRIITNFTVENEQELANNILSHLNKEKINPSDIDIFLYYNEEPNTIDITIRHRDTDIEVRGEYVHCRLCERPLTKNFAGYLKIENTLPSCLKELKKKIGTPYKFIKANEWLWYKWDSGKISLRDFLRELEEKKK